jgi:hypothetical protein
MVQNIFISWSGIRARELAVALYRFMPDVLQAARPWLSSEDIHKGRRWRNEIASALQDTRIGIICLTPENLHNDWILFEAGALAKTLDNAFVCPYLLGLEPSEVGAPLDEFQLTTADEVSTARMIVSINAALGGAVRDDQVRRTFDRFWPDFKAELDSIASTRVEDLGPNLNEEILQRLKRIEENSVGQLIGTRSDSAAMLMVRNEVAYLTTKYQIAKEALRRLETMEPSRDEDDARAREAERSYYVGIRDETFVEMEKHTSAIHGLLKGLTSSRTASACSSLGDASDPAS